jgi:hypothetical protein
MEFSHFGITWKAINWQVWVNWNQQERDQIESRRRVTKKRFGPTPNVILFYVGAYVPYNKMMPIKNNLKRILPCSWPMSLWLYLLLTHLLLGGWFSSKILSWFFHHDRSLDMIYCCKLSTRWKKVCISIPIVMYYLYCIFWSLDVKGRCWYFCYYHAFLEWLVGVLSYNHWIF